VPFDEETLRLLAERAYAATVLLHQPVPDGGGATSGAPGGVALAGPAPATGAAAVVPVPVPTGGPSSAGVPTGTLPFGGVPALAGLPFADVPDVPHVPQVAVPHGPGAAAPHGLPSDASQLYVVTERSAAGHVPAPGAPPVVGVPPADRTGWTVPDLAGHAWDVPAAPSAAPHVPGVAVGPGVPFDVEAVRRDFPILAERVHDDRPLVWFDNAATTQKPQVVIDRLAHFYAYENSNIHRAAHTLAARATDAYEDARQTVARFVGASSASDVVFVRGATEAINLVAQAWGGAHVGPGDEIVVTHLEHHANIVPWQQLARRTGAVLKVAPVDDRGNLLLDGLSALLGPRTRIVAVTHVSNALGTVVPVEQVVELAHRAGARVLVDAAQSVPHLRLDVARLGADFVVFSGHKVFGPTGIGVLYATPDAFEDTPPWQGGGNMIADVTLDRVLYQVAPARYEAGTGNIADAVGLAAALRYVEGVGIERIERYEHALLEYATPRLAAVPGVRLVGTADHKASVLSFVVPGRDPVAIGKALDREGIAVRAGHHCAQPILRRLGLEQTVRPSFAFYNTTAEIDLLVAAVERVVGSPHPGDTPAPGPR